MKIRVVRIVEENLCESKQHKKKEKEPKALTNYLQRCTFRLRFTFSFSGCDAAKKNPGGYIKKID